MLSTPVARPVLKYLTSYVVTDSSISRGVLSGSSAASNEQTFSNTGACATRKTRDRAKTPTFGKMPEGLKGY